METTRVGFVGMGTMGAPMAANIARAGFPLTVWNRTPGRASDVVSLGASEASSLEALARQVDVVVLCLTDSPQVAEVLEGPSGLAAHLAPGGLVIDCSTLSPLRAQDFARLLGEHQVGYLDAPVSGGSEGAQKGTLSIMIGGAADDVARADGVLRAMGQRLSHLGPVGAGQWAKAVNQVILAGTYLGVAEGVTLAVKAGLDAEAIVGALLGGAADSWVLANRSGRMIDDEYPLGFKLSLHRKDLAIALGLAETVGATLPVGSLAAQFEDELIAEGHGDDDNSALARAIRQRSGL